MCLAEWHKLIIILFAYWEVGSIIFLGLHDKSQIAKVIYAYIIIFFFLGCVIMEMDVRACELRGLLLHGGSIPLSY